MNSSMRSTEHELTLVICSDTPELIADRIGQLSEIPGYRLCHVADRSIKDSYFDTLSRELKSRGWALRVREIDESQLIALKGSPVVDDVGIVSRVEIEGAWSHETFEGVLRELSRRGIPISVTGMPERVSDPLKEIEATGFRLIQARETSRRVIDVLKLPENVRAVEMAVDAVAYRFEAGTVLHREVELESKAEIGHQAIRDVVQYLQSAFGTSLKTWPHSKLATGSALERLLGDRSIVLSSNASLRASDYEKIEALLRDGF